MNYIEQINRFYVWLVENPISGNAQALWHRLMAYCNAFGWKDDFTITNMRLIEDLGGISRQELDRVRNVLVQGGRVKYRKGAGNKCGSYTIIPFVSQDSSNRVTQSDTQSGHKPDTNRTQPDTQSGPLNKLNETKQNETKSITGGTGASAPTHARFTPPTVDEVAAYCQERRNGVDAQHWHDYYTSNGWLVGKNKMRDWKATVRTWEKNGYSNSPRGQTGKGGAPPESKPATPNAAELEQMKKLLTQMKGEDDAEPQPSG